MMVTWTLKWWQLRWREIDGFERYVRGKIGRVCDRLDMGDDMRGRLSRMMPRFMAHTNGYWSHLWKER